MDVELVDIAGSKRGEDCRERRREDAVDDGDCAEQALANAPETDAGYFTVPKVLE